jgi:hypothetical protein
LGTTPPPPPLSLSFCGGEIGEIEEIGEIGEIKGMEILVLAVVVIASLIILTTLQWLGRRNALQITGWGFLQLKCVCYSMARSTLEYHFDEWKLTKGAINEKLYRVFRDARFGVNICGLRIGFEKSQFRLLLSMESVTIFVSPPSRSPPSNGRPIPQRGRLSDLMIRLKFMIGRLMVRVIRLFWMMRIERINVIITQFPAHIKKLDLWTSLQITLSKVSIFEKGHWIGVAKAEAFECIISELEKSVICQRRILLVPELLLGPGSGGETPAPVPALEYRLTAMGITIDLWPTTLLLLTSMAKERPSPTEPKEGDPLTDILYLLSLIFPRRILCSLIVADCVNVSLHLPETRSEMNRFGSLIFTLERLKLFSCLDPGIIPKAMILGKRVCMGSRAADVFGSLIRSVTQRLFDANPEGQIEELLSLGDVVLANCWPQARNLPEDFELRDEVVQNWIQAVLRGSPIWTVNANSSEDGLFEVSMRRVKSVGENLYSKLENVPQPFHQEEYQLLPQTVLARMQSVAFDVPFEYPLSNLFEHLAYFIKTVQAPSQKSSHRQDFNPFSHDWKLIVMSEEAHFAIADDDFEVRLQRIFRMKRMVWGKFSRLEHLFWRQCAKEQASSPHSPRAGKERWVSAAQGALAAASEQPTILMGNPQLSQRYTILQEELFLLYKSTFEEFKKPAKPLFNISGRNAAVCMRWNRTFGDSMAKLLNAMEDDTILKDDAIRQFGLFLGGFLDISMCDLEVALRDYAVPLCFAKEARLMGLLFIVEEESYASAEARNLVPAAWGDQFEGQWNLTGLDGKARATVRRTILPTKIYHSLQLSAFSSSEPILSGFSPLLEGTFQTLDRAFELFSKPSEELSPFLPFWDKLRLLLRGVSSSVVVRGPCRIVGVAGTDLHSLDEHLSLVFPAGFALGLEGAQVRVKVPEAIAYVSSEHESILRWLHKTTGVSFSKTDRDLLGVPKGLAGHMPIVAFPRVEFVISFAIVGLNGGRPCSHSAVRVQVGDPTTRAGEDVVDSYRLFRIHGMSINIAINAAENEKGTAGSSSSTSITAPASRLMVFYYRELEDWFIRNFGHFVTPPVKAGPLFQFGTLSKKATPKLSSVLTEFKLKLAFDGLFCARGLQYYDTEDFGGVLLSSSGRTRIGLAFRKSIQKGVPSSNQTQWFQHFVEYDFSSMRLGVITKESNAEECLRSKGLPFRYGGAAMFDVLTAPRLFYIAVNQACFKRDAEAAAVQRRIIGGRLAELGREIDELSVKLRKCDPNKDMATFTRIKRDLSVLLEQHEYIGGFLRPATREASENDENEEESLSQNEKDKAKEKDERVTGSSQTPISSTTSSSSSQSPLIANHQFIIQNAQLLWHRDVRDCVFSLVDQQFQFFRCTHGLSATAVRLLVDLFTPPVHSGRHGRTGSTTPVNTPSQKGDSPNATEILFEELLDEEEAFEVGPESASAEPQQPGGPIRKSLMVDPAELFASGMYVSLRVDVDLISPQIVLLDTPAEGGAQAGIIITAQSASLKYGTVRGEEFGEVVGRRTKIVLEQALAHAAFRADFAKDQWPPHYPVEYLLTQETEAARFKRLSEKLSATFVYDVANQRFKYRNASSPVRRIFGEGDTLRVDANTISLLTTSSQYSALFDVIVNLLVYRDPTQKIRHEQLERIMLATDILQSPEVVGATIERMQSVVKTRLAGLGAKLSRALHRGVLKGAELDEAYRRLKAPWDAVALVVDALRTVRASREKLKEKQTRLLLDVLIGRIAWSLYVLDTSSLLCEMTLTGIHDRWLSAPDGTQSNLVEIGGIRATNRIPEAFYKTMIAPVPADVRNLLYATESGFRGIGTQGNAIRFFFKARPPVSGIRIIDHAELNLTPLHFQLTYDIAEEVIKFFFPPTKSEDQASLVEEEKEKGEEEGEGEGEGEKGVGLLGGIKSSIKTTASSFFSRADVDDADVELMKTRSAENCSFLYVIVPASQHIISFKVIIIIISSSFINISRVRARRVLLM